MLLVHVINFEGEWRCGGVEGSVDGGIGDEWVVMK